MISPLGLNLWFFCCQISRFAIWISMKQKLVAWLTSVQVSYLWDKASSLHPSSVVVRHVCTGSSEGVKEWSTYQLLFPCHWVSVRDATCFLSHMTYKWYLGVCIYLPPPQSSNIHPNHLPSRDALLIPCSFSLLCHFLIFLCINLPT